jgi:aspartyl-tRNA(Asn)/glutamyl-tRNA(Gln) amidotransferase subunit A
VVGLKPSYGRISRYGLIAYGSSLDCIGPLTHSVEDAALLLNVMAGPDSSDATCSKEAVPDFAAQLQSAEALGDKCLAGLRVGLISQTIGEGVAPGVMAAVNGALQHLQQLGAEVEEVSSM